MIPSAPYGSIEVREVMVFDEVPAWDVEGEAVGYLLRLRASAEEKAGRADLLREGGGSLFDRRCVDALDRILAGRDASLSVAV